jgi:DNA repair exonuclease SbcCD ATPase subunit
MEKIDSEIGRHMALVGAIKDIETRSPMKELKAFEVRMKALESKIEAEDASEPKLLEQKLSDSRSKLKQLKKEFERLFELKLEKEREVIKLEALKEGYKEVKAYTFQNVLNQLSRKANKYLSELFEQPVKIKFENIDMKIDVAVNIDGRDRPLGLYSGGQFRRIALAVDLALSDITMARSSNKLNLIILDEYCKDLSETSMNKVLNLLQARKGSTILIEHNSIFRSIVNQTFEVELRDGVSRRVK